MRWNYKKEIADYEAKQYLVPNCERAGWIVLYKNKPIGTALFDVNNEDVSIKYSPWLFLLWIEPEHRGYNLGIELTKKRLNYAKKCGYKIVYIDTIDAEEYHKKLGWEKIEEINYLGQKNVIMMWDLSKKFPINKDRLI